MKYVRAAFIFLIVCGFGALVGVSAGVTWGTDRCGILVTVTGLAALSYSATALKKRKK